MRARFVTGITAIVVLIAAFSTDTPLRAAGTCNDGSLRGSYAFRVDGTGAGGFAGPFAAVGKNTYDGKGGLSGTIVVSTNGTVIATDYTGTYSVAASCTGTKSATLTNGPTVDFHFVVDSDGRGIQMIVTAIGGAAGHTISGSASKMFTGSKDQGARHD